MSSSKDWKAEIKKMGDEWRKSHLKPMVEAAKQLHITDLTRLAETPIPDVRTLSQEALKISVARSEMERRGVPFKMPVDGDSLR